MSDYLMTIDSDVEDVLEASGEANIRGDLDPDFIFDVSGDPYNAELEFGTENDTVHAGTRPVRCLHILLRTLAHVSARTQYLWMISSSGDS